MSKKTHTWKYRAVGAKTGRDAAPILTQVKEPKVKAKQTEVISVLPLLTERLALKETVILEVDGRELARATA